jgi:ribosomal protein S18 acetylase RimI-like enzyme
VSNQLLAGYQLRLGLERERRSLAKFLKLSYQELYPEQNDFSHLTETVNRYFSRETPLWWVELDDAAVSGNGNSSLISQSSGLSQPVGCLWLGNAVDQVQGDRHAHIFLLYVMPEHRRRGIGSALMHHAEEWARARGDRQIGLQVFQSNQPALNLYQQLGYQTQSLWMVKPLRPQPLE